MSDARADYYAVDVMAEIVNRMDGFQDSVLAPDGRHATFRVEVTPLD